jgi:pimeloyl-ACP methyl ester carboxylesterase
MGKFDKVTPRDANVDGLMGLGLSPDRVFELNTGHMVMLEAPEELNTILGALIQQFESA